jgi:hypothetical protein
MRLLSLFTSQAAVSSAILAISVFTSSATAQDRTTEQGEAQITGEHLFFHSLPSTYGCQPGAEIEKHVRWANDNVIFCDAYFDASWHTSLQLLAVQFERALFRLDAAAHTNKREPRIA